MCYWNNKLDWLIDWDGEERVKWVEPLYQRRPSNEFLRDVCAWSSTWRPCNLPMFDAGGLLCVRTICWSLDDWRTNEHATFSSSSIVERSLPGPVRLVASRNTAAMKLETSIYRFNTRSSLDCGGLLWEVDIAIRGEYFAWILKVQRMLKFRGYLHSSKPNSVF